MFKSNVSKTIPESLTQQLREGSEEAFEQVYHLYHKHLYAIALKYLKNPDLAEDALQEVFLKLWNVRQELDDDHSLKAYLSVVMRNHVLNVIRNQQREIANYVEYTLNWSESDDEGDENKRLEQSIWLLEQGVSQLSPQKKRIFQLRITEHLNNEQIAQLLGLSINTVKFQFSQSLHFLRTYIRNRTEILLLLLLWKVLF
ncbi:MAG: sigma-70 family RNA polymerase sigma factor [Spirosomaceae bacterium]|jgi:RNA polymerase sigma-70 factor (ECF subfamily)|nr:sigma-70 family RNA polymerase sigma factor [Spirosomataceae bacterium]